MREAFVVWLTAGTITALLSVQHPVLLVIAAVTTTAAMLLAPGPRRALGRAAVPLLVAVAVWWVAIVLVVPGSPTGDVVWQRPTATWGPGVTWGGPLTSDSLGRALTAMCRAVAVVALAVLAGELVPGRRWLATARGLLGGRASLIAVWCLTNDSLTDHHTRGLRGRRLLVDAVADARRRADGIPLTRAESPVGRWLRWLIGGAIIAGTLAAVALDRTDLVGWPLLTAVLTALTVMAVAVAAPRWWRPRLRDLPLAAAALTVTVAALATNPAHMAFPTTPAAWLAPSLGLTVSLVAIPVAVALTDDGEVSTGAR